VDEVPHTVAWDWETTYDGSDLIGPGPLWAFTDNPDKVMQCPAYQGSTNFAADPYTGYNYNTSFIGGEAMCVDVGWDVVRLGLPTHLCRRASSTAIFGCGGYAGGTNKFMRSPTSPNGWPMQMIYSGGQAFHYFDCTNVAYLDGHVGSFCNPRKGANATEELLANFMHFPDNGFLSDGDDAYDPR
jgi:prepilin-type processing-associated H-X9-DG protein